MAETFTFLKQALLAVEESAPFRGPPRFEKGVWLYNNHFQGDIQRFSGGEIIFKEDEKVFSQNYIGGLIVPK